MKKIILIRKICFLNFLFIFPHIYHKILHVDFFFPKLYMIQNQFSFTPIPSMYLLKWVSFDSQ